MQQQPLIVSYYADEPGRGTFAGYAALLKLDLERIRLPYEITRVPYQGTWLKTCRQKPAFLLAALNRYDRPLIWIDADSRVHQPELSRSG